MKIIWAIPILALTNVKVVTSANIVSCDTFDVRDEIADLNYRNKQLQQQRYGYGYYNTNPPEPLYSYGICNKVTLNSGVTLSLSKTKLKYIVFQNSSIGTIPPRIFQNYLSLESLYINNSYVVEIDLNAFADLKNLKELYLENNQLTDIGKGIYNNLQNLQILDISNNQIHTVEKKAFHGLVSLQNLNISYNKIQNISLDIFDSELHSLYALDLSHNFLSEIDLNIISNLFSRNSATSQIELSNNAIKSLNFSQLTCNLNKLNLRNNNLNTLIDLQNSKIINELDLSNNNISEFHRVPKNIKYLNLSRNALTNLNISTFSHKIEINILDVSQNSIKYLNPDTFYNMSTLTYLSLANNKLTEIPIGIFKNVNLLSSLNLSGNLLQQFEFGTFSGLENLTELDISNNSFQSLDAKTFYTFTNLVKLNIANNKLTTLNPYNILSHCKSLKVMVLNDNPWNCESLLNLSNVLKSHGVKILYGQNQNTKNFLGHMCFESENFLVTESSVINRNSLKNEIDGLENSQANTVFETLNDYFNKDFKNTEFYKYFNRNFSINYERSLNNFTDTLNLINSRLSQTERNLGNLDEAGLKFFNFFNEGFKKSNFYKYFDQNFTNMLTNLKTANEFDDDFKNSFYKFFLTKTTGSNVDQVSFNTALPNTEAQLSSNISYAKLIDDVHENNGVKQQIASLSNSLTAFMSILIILLFSITLLLVFIVIKFVNIQDKKMISDCELAQLRLE